MEFMQVHVAVIVPAVIAVLGGVALWIDVKYIRSRRAKAVTSTIVRTSLETTDVNYAPRYGEWSPYIGPSVKKSTIREAERE